MKYIYKVFKNQNHNYKGLRVKAASRGYLFGENGGDVRVRFIYRFIS